MVRPKVDDARLADAIEDSRIAYERAEPRFFDYLQDDVRVYNLNSVEPMVGRKEFETAFMPAFKRKRNVKVIESDVRESGDQAVLAQTLEVSDEQEDVALCVRQTVVWEQEDAEWRVSHIHVTLVGQPVMASERLPESATAVRVLNERIATVAACVGVAQ
jgi:ketosteroid isomerase-like protein